MINIDPTTGKEFKPTITRTKDFNPENDAEELLNAFRGLGTDEDAIIRILSNRTFEERRKIHSEFASTYGKNLLTEIKYEISDEFEKIALNLFDSPIFQLAASCRDALKGAGTNEKLLLQVIVTSTNHEIKRMTEVYASEYNRSLIEDVESDVSGMLKRFLVAILQGNRDEIDFESVKTFESSGDLSDLVDFEKAEIDAKELYEAGENRLGTDEETFLKILCKRNSFQIAEIGKIYEKLYGKSFLNAIDDLANVDRCSLYADILHEAVDGAGTDDDTLIKIISLRCDIDLGTIKERYQEKYGESLYDRVKSETSGDYKRMLLEIIKP